MKWTCNLIVLPVAITLIAFIATVTGDSDCECGLNGLSIVKSRIYQGKTTEPSRFPWMSYIMIYSPYSSTHVECGGTLIDDQHVLTAAHCLYTAEGNLVQVNDIVLFLNIVDKPWHHREAISVSSYVYHEEFDPNNDWIMANDIAILKLAKPILRNASIPAICLPESEKPAYEKLIIAGYGALDSEDTGSDTLQDVEVNLIPRSKCESQRVKFVEERIPSGEMDKAEIPYLTESHLCTINEKTRGDSCSGDSGGPLMYWNPDNARWYIIAVVSGSWTSCGHPDVPGIYTSVAKFADFIRQNTGKPCFRPY